MSPSISILESSEPELTLQQCLEAFNNREERSSAFAFTFSARQDYLPGAPAIELLALFAVRRTAGGIEIGVSVIEPQAEMLDAISGLEPEWTRIEQWCHESNVIWLDLSRAIQLKPVHIPKPWGQEIWYTGIEERGQSSVVDEHGHGIPLPWLLSLFPRLLLGPGQENLILLKVLDPLPEPVFGDLYFEMHEEKREVYVVTHVDEKAWPDGQGGIRFGFSQSKRQELQSDAEFKQQYLETVDEYRYVRRQIDELLDQRRRDLGVALNEPVDPSTLKAWLADVPADMQSREAALRMEMESFIHVDPLRVGDVVKVPCYTPHSLLHGVRTVEFQTPVYERKILSFAQKVLTQSHWDTEEAMEMVSLDAPEAAELPLVREDASQRVEEVVDFEDFRVERFTLQPGAACDIVPGREYALLMTVTGGFVLEHRPLQAEQAVLLPAGDTSQQLKFNGDGLGVFLLARPKSQS